MKTTQKIADVKNQHFDNFMVKGQKMFTPLASSHREKVSIQNDSIITE